MNWTKVILIFQAAVTLLIGITFFISSMGFVINTDTSTNPDFREVNQNFSNAKERFQTASYILLVIALIELIIISEFI